jgi:hypothetical protein
MTLTPFRCGAVSRAYNGEVQPFLLPLRGHPIIEGIPIALILIALVATRKRL